MVSIKKLEAGIAQLRNGAGKLRWGVRTVGILAAVRGIARWTRVVLTRPQQADVRVASGFTLEYRFPSQFPSALVMFGDLIDPEFAFLRKVFEPGWIVADVGAAIGQFTVFSANLPDAVVHAYEPSSSNIEMLKRNVARNRVSDRVHVHQLALSNKIGESVFETAGHTWVSQLRPGAQNGEVVAVRTLTDEFQRLNLERLNILKINVAGFEPEVLEGAMPLLATGKVDIMILLLALRSLQWFATIAEHGYRFFYYHPGKRLLYEVKAFDESSVLDHRPWPARHIIAIHSSLAATTAVKSLIAGTVGSIPDEAGRS